MRKRVQKYFAALLSVTIALGFLSYIDKSPFAYAETTISSVDAQKAALEAELAKLEAEIAEKEKVLASQKGESASISRDIKVLTTQIEKTKLDIKSKNLTISKLQDEIKKKNSNISDLDQTIDKTKDSLAQLIRKTNEIDQTPVVHLVLSNSTLSEFYRDIDSFEAIKKSVKANIEEIRGVRKETEKQREELKTKEELEMDAKQALESAKRKVELSESEKQKLLSVSKSKEKTYEQLLAERKAKAAQIRSALFSLRDSAAIPFGDALAYAEAASAKTGVRPAFLLAILTQESSLGKNVGSCYLKDPITGSGVGITSGNTIANVMKPTRDVGPFLTITKELGREPYSTRVSCPIGGLGYGGAMGPSQFIPSTWAMIKTRIANAVGVKTADPWNPEHAFMASAIYLSDLGAGAGTYTAERNAACRYYSGRVCDSKSPPNTFYGNSVMAKATSIQETMIDPLQGL